MGSIQTAISTIHEAQRFFSPLSVVPRPFRPSSHANARNQGRLRRREAKRESSFFCFLLTSNRHTSLGCLLLVFERRWSRYTCVRLWSLSFVSWGWLFRSSISHLVDNNNNTLPASSPLLSSSFLSTGVEIETESVGIRAASVCVCCGELCPCLICTLLSVVSLLGVFCALLVGAGTDGVVCVFWNFFFIGLCVLNSFIYLPLRGRVFFSYSGYNHNRVLKQSECRCWLSVS